LEARLVVVKQSSVAVNGQPSKEAILEILPEVSADDDSIADQLKQHVLPEVNSKSPEEREMDKFLNEAYKKSISDKTRQHNKEKKL
ncbi:473_t:CDS:1, partial [Acaulospora morrowiae]